MHPLTPLVKGVRSFWFVIAAISWQGFARLGLERGAMIVAAFGVLGLIWSWIGWYVTGYQVADGELRIADGILTRSRRTIPVARLQAVDVVRPLLARLLGLAELRLEVAGGAKTEAPLSYLTLGRARDLRRELLAASRPEAAAADDGEAVLEPVAAAAPLVMVPARRLLAAQLMTPQILFLPIAVAVTVWLFAIDPDLSILGLAGMFTAVAGILFQPVKEAFVNYGFTGSVTDDGLRIRHGLFEQRQQTLPLRRVTAVTIRSPLLWRPVGWVRAHVASAAYSATNAGTEAFSGRSLLPVGTRAEAAVITAAVLPGADIDGLVYRGLPRRARWRAPLRWRFFGVCLTDEHYAVRSGRWSPTEAFVPYGRILSVRVTQGRWQRLLALATVHVDLAGTISVSTAARHRPLSEAVTLARDLVRRSQQNRPVPPG
ncbi:PH domain-containing protein [Phytomonospora endophytica]|uniref:Putative membrane protein n=1 Tax=Phytomonospora endophytica TaxID=714109 RepID=A0A841FJX4_9ACTN|nr:PH domain-containing protein [Phytomonospora endophytica]MBB6033862.1 putative membrane protein [Phytomonospora endophytica]